MSIKGIKKKCDGSKEKSNKGFKLKKLREDHDPKQTSFSIST
jgi:hypothetical protein